MTRRRTRGTAGAIGAFAVLFVAGVQAVAGAVLWTMTASPLTATVGTATTLTLTATNLDPLLGVKCVTAEIPAAIAPGDVWLVGSSTTAPWVVSRSGPQVTAMIDTGAGNEKLHVGDWVAFAVNGVPVQSGAYAIAAVAYSNHGCSEGVRPLAAPPVIVISGALIALPPDPTPGPTPTPEPIIVLPSILPTPKPQPPAVIVRPTPRAASARPAPAVQDVAPATPRPAPSVVAAPASPSSSPRPSGAVGSVVATSAGPPAADEGDSRRLALPRGEPGDGDVSLALGQFSLIDGVEVWAVPGAVVGGPGLLVILWVAVQAGVALASVPAVRRLRGDARFGGRVRRT